MIRSVFAGYKFVKSQFVNVLELIINQCINIGSSPLKWKKANVVPVHKKGDKDNKKLPISLTAFNLRENTLETKSCLNVKVSFLKQIDFFKSIWFQ